MKLRNPQPISLTFMWIRHFSLRIKLYLFILFFFCSAIFHASAVQRVPELSSIAYGPYSVINIHPEITVGSVLEGRRQLDEIMAEGHRQLDMARKREEIQGGFKSLYSKVAGLQAKLASVRVWQQLKSKYAPICQISDTKSQNMGKLFEFLAKERQLGWA